MSGFKTIEDMERESQDFEDGEANFKLTNKIIEHNRFNTTVWLRVIWCGDTTYRYYIDSLKSTEVTREQAKEALLIENQHRKGL